MSATTFGVVIGNRGFFPDILARDGREEILRTLEQQGYRAICLTPQDNTFGSVETLQDARKCAELFKQHREQIDGILVSLPNLGDEPSKMLMGGRRDSFCGKISACNNLWQYGIRYTLTSLHTEAPSSGSFQADMKAFAASCRIVKGLRNVRVGVLGARPAAFNTVRFSEKLMERHGITVETLDLSEVFGRIARLKDNDAQVKAKLSSIQGY